jgi:hypothetical protein
VFFSNFPADFFEKIAIFKGPKSSHPPPDWDRAAPHRQRRAGKARTSPGRCVGSCGETGDVNQFLGKIGKLKQKYQQKYHEINSST